MPHGSALIYTDTSVYVEFMRQCGAVAGRAGSGLSLLSILTRVRTRGDSG